MKLSLKRIIYYLIKLRSRIFLPFFLLYILITSYIILMIEPETFGSYLTALYWVMTALATVGFGDYAPVTDAGKAFTIFLYVTGIGMVSVFIGNILESVYRIEKMRVGGKMKYTGSNHIILIGWSEKSKAAVEEIITSDNRIDIVLIDHLEKSPIIDEHLFYVRGDATNEETLMRANLPEAKGVIIFAEDPLQANDTAKDPLLADGKTLLIATAITSIEEQMNLSIHVTAEVIHQKHIRLFERVKVDEFIPTNEMISHAAVRSLFSHGITHIYAELMSRQVGESIYEIAKRPQWVTYRDAFMDLLDEGATLVADHSNLHINQKLDERIPAGARLFVMCDKEVIAKIQPDAND
ncbi:ion channel [Domibacillus sp. DTU_2020_1001157_1_SI_ALB_TIR_016]|uniref:potassium channel protein n=1 Tax=Domibacillus sp. DTU_2020_1001157_1_SI_ALB_TIR_016 TaxID=3077789 RepID=UPI0028E9D04D|nr:ion channel [Domibacillus sp. DTU_2020_1001157_1_SI_ALB_TIR_016]WNS78382.1 ion channel [Domibacillus sp. DTU_2020_1001157_1_SI_ALB_TIR_016]